MKLFSTVGMSAVTLLFVGVTSGCAGLATFLGISKGGGGGGGGGSDDNLPNAIIEGVSALETGGWTAAILVTAMGLAKAAVKAWGAAKASGARRKKANGKPE